MKKEKGFVIFILFCFLIETIFVMGLVSAQIESLSISKLNTYVQLTQAVTNSTYCNLTKVQYPNNTIQTIGIYMTKNGNDYNYTYFTNALGEHSYITCCNPDGVETCVGVTFDVTPNGEEASISNALFYYGMIFLFFITLISCIYLSIKLKKIWMRMLFVCLSYLSLIIITFIIWQMCVNFVSGISFIPTITYMIWVISMICFFPFIIIMGLYILNLEAKELEVTTKIKMGYSEDEARNGLR